MDTEEWDKHYGSKNIMKVHEDNIYFENKLMLVKKTVCLKHTICNSKFLYMNLGGKGCLD